MWRLKSQNTTGLKGYRALGRKKTGELNKTESAYQQFLEKEKQEGRILDYRFEELKLKIGEPACWYMPDFLVINADREIEFHEVKGAAAIFQDDAKVKIKAAAYRNSHFIFKVVYPDKKELSGWRIQEF